VPIGWTREPGRLGQVAVDRTLGGRLAELGAANGLFHLRRRGKFERAVWRRWWHPSAARKALGVTARASHVVRAATRYARRPDVRRDRGRLVARRCRYALDAVVRPEALRRVKLVKFDDDLVIGVRRDEEVGRAIYKYGVYEFFCAELFRTLVRPGMTVVDAGANIGQYTLFAAKRVGRAGTVLSFEPNPRTFAALQKNVAANGLEDIVRLFGSALSDVEGDFPLYVSPQEFNSGMASLRPYDAHPSPEIRALAAADPAIVTVRCRRLDDVLEDTGITRIDVIKADVEGAELAVLAGGAGVIDSAHPAILFEVNDLDETSRQAPSMKWLIGRGYGLYGIEASDRGDWWLTEVHDGDDPTGFKEHLQIRKDLVIDPFPDISPNLVALHPDSSHAALLERSRGTR
jgi:FkbM family methyltransferase